MNNYNTENKERKIMWLTKCNDAKTYKFYVFIIDNSFWIKFFE